MNIEVSNLTKRYRNHNVLDGLSFEMKGPAIVGLLGHNGAGKTSFLNILSGLVAPSEGSISIDGQSVFDHGELMKNICVIGETGNFPAHVTVAQVMKLNQYFYPNWNNELAEELLVQFSLNKKMKVKTMSKGMVSALGIITGIASEAPVTIFDEPYIGMDAAGRHLFYDLLIEQFSMNPRLIILSTHLVDEASELFEDVYIMHEGRLILKQSYEELQSRVFRVKGKLEDVERYIVGQQVLHRSQFMNEHIAVIMSDGNEQPHSGLKREAVKLQELLILLSKNQRKEQIR
ncbi:ABC transporter ATP-binding protein [Paenibacillus endoradicis]|uniref:ABC transporter ATP-binding protein n=1 Tax=Paenibacillus endoradicis TaxID=2972487 RepID=UPI002158C6B1|nr:ABC transporter ATP-binding protein [Paenibacillus endoradicis]MCR8660034.1 ABC transporter ATP-binding protein [Paenibacillus endoradicis]